MNYVIDLKPLIDQVIFPLLEAALMPFVAVAVAKIAQLAHVQMTKEQAQKIEGAFYHGLQFALSRAKERGDDLSQISVKNKLIADAANYVIPKMPSAIKALKMSEKGINDRLEARLNQLLEEKGA